MAQKHKAVHHKHGGILCPHKQADKLLAHTVTTLQIKYCAPNWWIMFYVEWDSRKKEKEQYS